MASGRARLQRHIKRVLYGHFATQFYETGLQSAKKCQKKYTWRHKRRAFKIWAHLRSHSEDSLIAPCRLSLESRYFNPIPISLWRFVQKSDCGSCQAEQGWPLWVEGGGSGGRGVGADKKWFGISRQNKIGNIECCQISYRQNGSNQVLPVLWSPKDSEVQNCHSVQSLVAAGRQRGNSGICVLPVIAFATALKRALQRQAESVAPLCKFQQLLMIYSMRLFSKRCSSIVIAAGSCTPEWLWGAQPYHSQI